MKHFNVLLSCMKIKRFTNFNILIALEVCSHIGTLAESILIETVCVYVYNVFHMFKKETKTFRYGFINEIEH